MKRKFLSPLAALAFAGFFSAHTFADEFYSTTNAVGRHGDALVTPANQLVTPAGMQVELPGLRPNAMALSPDGKILVTSGITNQLIAIDPVSGKCLQSVALPSGEIQEAQPLTDAILDADKKAQLSFTGLKFSPDGSRLYLANVNGDVKVFSVARDKKISPLFSIPLPQGKY